MNEVRLKELAKRLMTEHGLIEKGWRFRTYCNTDKYTGQCRHDQRVIRMNKLTAFINEDRHVENTLRHEIAHAVVGVGHGHGPVWREMAVRLGAEPRHCVADDYQMPPPRPRLVKKPR
jgi:predicted SprT family Zn-dependent metalloprotease